MPKFFEEAGLPKGVLNVLTVDIADIGDYFIAHPVPKVISFTGSTAVGRHVGEVASRNLKRVSLELGGNSPFVVLEDADLEKALSAALFGKFFSPRTNLYDYESDLRASLPLRSIRQQFCRKGAKKFRTAILASIPTSLSGRLLMKNRCKRC